MSKNEFDAFVRKQQASEKEDKEFDPQAELREWRTYLSELYNQIGTYLKSYLDDGSVHTESRTISLNEEFIGEYEVQELIVKIGRSTVTFVPIGTILIGSKGRVDVKGPVGSARLTLMDKQVTHVGQLIKVTATIGGSNSQAPVFEETPRRKIEWVWKIATPPPEMTYLELTQDNFFNMFLAVANG